MAIFNLLSMSLGQATAVVALTIIAVYLYFKRAERLANPHRLPYPPGPKPLPIIGNVLDIARENEAQAYQQLAREHGASHVLTFRVVLTSIIGDLVFLSALGKHILFVNSFQHAYELFEKRSANYADRPTSVMSGELCVTPTFPSFATSSHCLLVRMGWDFSFVHMRYGEFSLCDKPSLSYSTPR
jgi:hypothetical protein